MTLNDPAPRIHLSSRHGGCAAHAHPTAITDPRDFHKVNCPICLGALKGATMTTDEPTPCYGKSSLFDSTHETDHQLARALCLECPIRDTDCETNRRATIQELGIMSLEGTWAGKLHTGRKERPRGACGTRSGYNGHRYRNEVACRPCKDAEAAAARAVKAAKKAAAAAAEETAA